MTSGTLIFHMKIIHQNTRCTKQKLQASSNITTDTPSAFIKYIFATSYNGLLWLCLSQKTFLCIYITKQTWVAFQRKSKNTTFTILTAICTEAFVVMWLLLYKHSWKDSLQDTIPCYSLFAFHSETTWAPSQFKGRLFRYGDFHDKDTTVVRPSYLYNGNSYIDNTFSLYWELVISIIRFRGNRNSIWWYQ